MDGEWDVFFVSEPFTEWETRSRRRGSAQEKHNTIECILTKFGERMVLPIYIPSTLIDDYNYWMGGVDVANQRISYYHPSKLVCKRSLIVSIFMQLLSIIRNNVYLVLCQSSEKLLTPKNFVITWYAGC